MQPSEHTATRSTQTVGLRRVMGFGDVVLYIGGGGWRRLAASPSYMIVAALLGLTLGIVPNLLGLQFGKWISNVGAFARWAATLALIIIGLMAWVRLGPATRFTRASLTPGLGVRDL